MTTLVSHRAGHAHAGVLIILSLVAVIMADAAGLHGGLGWTARIAIPVAAVLMSSGFFVSSLGEGRDEPNGLIILLWLGAVSLATGVVTLGIGLLRSALARPISETADAAAQP